MKPVFLLFLDGPPDRPCLNPEQSTILEVARTPKLKDLTATGAVGRVVIGSGDGFGTEDSWRAILGIDYPVALPRGPLVSSSLEVPLERRDLVFACPVVTGTTDSIGEEAVDLADADARSLDDALRPLWSRRFVRFAEGAAAVLRWTDGAGRAIRVLAPEEVAGKPLESALPVGDGADLLTALIYDSLEILDAHPVNRRRRDAGQAPLLALWPWGAGTALVLPDPFPGFRSATIGSDPGFLGLGRAAGMRVVRTEPTGNIEVACRLRAEAAFDSARRGDLLIAVHLRRDAATVDGEIAAAEAIDRDLLGVLRERCDRAEVPWRMLLVWNAYPVESECLYLSADSEATGRQSLPFDRRGQEDTRLVKDGATLLRDLLRGT